MTISVEGLRACQAYLAAAPASLRPDLKMLLTAWQTDANSPIEDARLWPDEGNPLAIAVTFGDKNQRTPRLFDPAAFCMLLLLSAFSGSFRFNKDHKKKTYTDERGLFYVTISLPGLPNLAIDRLIADCPDGKQVKQISKRSDDDLAGSHYDLRRSNLRLLIATPTTEEPYPTKRTKRGRPNAIKAAIMGLRRFQARHPRRSGFPPTQKAYRQMLMDTFALIDRIPLGTPSPSKPDRPAAE